MFDLYYSMDTIKINGEIFEKGETGSTNIDIANLPSGTKINMPVDVFRSKKEGPVLLVCAGMHGDEVNGIEMVRRTLAQKLYNNLTCGSVIVIPLINIFGFIHFSRELPDGKDVNRSFPGSKTGSLAAQVAHVLSKQIFPIIDYAIDFHTGGSTRYNYPQIRYTKGDSKSEELAKAFASPVIIANSVIEKSFRKEAIKQGKSTIVFEGGESLRYDSLSLKIGIEGIKRVLTHLKMLPTDLSKSPTYTTVFIKKMYWQRAKKSGIYTWYINSGNTVKAGELLGTINDPQNKYTEPVIAEKSGFIVGHNNATVINRGDALFHIGW